MVNPGLPGLPGLNRARPGFVAASKRRQSACRKALGARASARSSGATELRAWPFYPRKEKASGKLTYKAVPPSYKLVYNPNNYRYIYHKS